MQIHADACSCAQSIALSLVHVEVTVHYEMLLKGINILSDGRKFIQVSAGSNHLFRFTTKILQICDFFVFFIPFILNWLQKDW